MFTIKPLILTVVDYGGRIGKRIKAWLKYHTYSNLLVFPYGALVRETPDFLIYR
ncbi:MAG: hypothetical protein ABIK27_07970 [Bacteroidota bacterium]